MAPKAKSKRQYTKGDWDIRTAVANPDVLYIYGEGGRILARIGNGQKIEAQANAVLMASAAAMLDCLQKWQAFMLDNYTQADISFYSQTNAVIEQATGQVVPASWRAALPDLALDAALEHIDSAIRPFLYAPMGSHTDKVRAGRCLAAAHDDYGVGFHQCGRKGQRTLFGALVCQQHYRIIRASLVANRARKA